MFSNMTSNLKRGSIVAALALTISVISGMAANALPGNLFITTGFVGAGTQSATLVGGPANTSSITAGATPEFVSISGGTFAGGLTTATLLANASIAVQIPTTATITISGFIQTGPGVFSSTVTDTIVLTVVTSLPGTVYANSIIYGEAGTAGAPNALTDAAFSVKAPSNGVNVAQFSVAEVDAAGVPVFGAAAKPIIVTVSAGVISSYDLTAPTAIPNTTYISAVPTTPTSHFLLSGVPGMAANAIITFIINGYSKVYKVTFVGSAAKIVLTPINPVVGVGLATVLLPSSAKATGITANTNAVEIQEFDSIGNLLTPNPALISIASTTPGIASGGAIDNAGTRPLGNITGGTPTSTSVLGLSVNGIAAGTTTLVATDASTGISSLPVSIRVSSGIPTSVVLTTDSNMYVTGGAGTLTTTLSNSAGILPAGTYVVFTGQANASIVLTAGTSTLPGAPTAIASIGGSIPVVVGQVTIKSDGTYTSAFSAPASAGTIIINGTPAAGTIAVTPAIFTVSTGNSDPAADFEATNADYSATDAVAAVTATVDAADLVALNADSKAAATTAVVSALTTAVTDLLAKIVARALLISKILKALKK